MYHIVPIYIRVRYRQPFIGVKFEDEMGTLWGIPSSEVRHHPRSSQQMRH